MKQYNHHHSRMSWMRLQITSLKISLFGRRLFDVLFMIWVIFFYFWYIIYVKSTSTTVISSSACNKNKRQKKIILTMKLGGNLENPLLSLQQTDNNKSRINQTTRQQGNKALMGGMYKKFFWYRKLQNDTIYRVEFYHPIGRSDWGLGLGYRTTDGSKINLMIEASKLALYLLA